jgi:signal transduction histidine kinase
MLALIQHGGHSSYMPHGMCYLWQPGLLWVHVISDTLIGLAYFAIPPTLLVLVVRARREVPEGAEYMKRGLPHEWMFVAFGLFIVACGATHFMGVWNVWNADYWTAGGIKIVTAMASVATAATLPPLIPRALRLIRDAREGAVRQTRLESANRELASLNERLRELDEAKTRLFANVSHELRTPLTLILGTLAARMDAGADEALGQDLDLIMRNARLLQKRVDDLLDLARSDAGQAVLDAQPVDAAEVVRLTAARFESLAAGRGVDIDMEAPGSVPAVLDVDRIERILDNLLSNAVKFTPAGGTIRVSLQHRDNEICLSVDDSGPGIPTELREAVFERFRQVDPSTTRVRGGSGLGLAIVREFARLHGGDVNLQDSELGGVRFEVTLPYRPASEGRAAPWEPSDTAAAELLADASPAEPASVSPAAPDAPVRDAGSPPAVHSADAEEHGAQQSGHARPVVLVVEDNADMRSFICRILADDFDCRTAADGEEAIALLDTATDPPDVILTDVMMPRMDGPGLLAEVRARPRFDDTAIVALSAVAESEMRVAMLRHGAQDYVTKPFEGEELRVRVWNLAAMRGARAALRQELQSAGHDIQSMARELGQRRRDLEWALAEARAAEARATAGDRAKTEFLAVMSHELRTPLNAVIGYADLLGAGIGGPLTPAQQQHVARIRAAARNLLSIIDDILVYARLEAGEDSYRSETVAVAGLLEEIADLVRPEAAQRGLDLAIDMEQHVTVRSDREPLRRIITNLVANAVKFTASGEVRIQARSEGDQLRIAVTDTGRGIPADSLERVFSPFWQVDQSTTRSAGGSGLGLSIARRLALRLGGDIEVESEEGRGSTFTLILPLDNDASDGR